jgi:hypothetical protein
VDITKVIKELHRDISGDLQGFIRLMNTYEAHLKNLEVAHLTNNTDPSLHAMNVRCTAEVIKLRCGSALSTVDLYRDQVQKLNAQKSNLSSLEALQYDAASYCFNRVFNAFNEHILRLESLVVDK